jgi:uncharacterized protein YjbI with pentapeptide repeats
MSLVRRVALLHLAACLGGCALCRESYRADRAALLEIVHATIRPEEPWEVIDRWHFGSGRISALLRAKSDAVLAYIRLEAQLGATGRALIEDADLRGIQLDGKSLRGISFHRCFFGPHEDPSKGVHERFQFASFAGSDLTDASFKGSFLGSLNMIDAVMDRVDMTYSVCPVSNFTGASLRFAMAFNSNLEDSKFERADLEGANLRWCMLSGCDFRYANLKSADLTGTMCTRVDRSPVPTPTATIVGLPPSLFQHADLRGARLAHANMSGVDLKGANLAGAEITACDLRGAEHTATAIFDGAFWRQDSPPQVSGELAERVQKITASAVTFERITADGKTTQFQRL